jgi:hypothetical protein
MPLAAKDVEGLDWVVPLTLSRGQIADATHFRSTWLTASQATLRERGLFAKYETLIDPAKKSEVLGLIAGTWATMETAAAHYSACDALDLSTPELLEIGAAATRRANATHLAFVLRLAKGAGVTPWTILGQIQRIWDRTFQGGGQVGVARIGPKDARFEIIGYPLARLRYNRITMRGIANGLVELFCERSYVKEIPKLCNARSVGLHLSWV